ncbi:hypothetical protein BDR26DRAFT_868917 [Obelidium mucronatum]|nr:hypothetical protein BDR26DRAFT_868917 [Obelidium mucronatum]
MAMHSLKGPGGVELVSIFGNDSINHPETLPEHQAKSFSDQRRSPKSWPQQNSPDHLPQKSIDYNPDTIPPSLSQPPCKKNLKCPFPGCNKIFTQSYNVKPHYRLHFNVRPYNCDTCIATFALCLDVFGRLDSLQRHTKLHAR